MVYNESPCMIFYNIYNIYIILTLVKEVMKKKSGNYKLYAFSIKEEKLNKLRAKAYWDRCTLTFILNDIIEDYLKDKEIDPIPCKYKSS